jgi:hypothetical protein
VVRDEVFWTFGKIWGGPAIPPQRPLLKWKRSLDEPHDAFHPRWNSYRGPGRRLIAFLSRPVAVRPYRVRERGLSVTIRTFLSPDPGLRGKKSRSSIPGIALSKAPKEPSDGAFFPGCQVGEGWVGRSVRGRGSVRSSSYRHCWLLLSRLN